MTKENLDEEKIESIPPSQKEPSLKKRRFGITNKLLILYDALIVCLVSVSLLMMLGRTDNLSVNYQDIAIQCAIAVMCIFSMRFAWRIYTLIWRYGGIQSYIRLMLSDACGFLLYWRVERLLPVVHISVVRLLLISCMALLGSLCIRMVYRYAYKCCRTDTVLGKCLNIIVKIFAGNHVELDDDPEIRKIKIAIVGAGRTGAGFAEELLNNKSSVYVPKCFIDIDSEKIGRRIYDVPVISERKLSQNILSKYEIQEIVFALPRMAAEEKKRLYEYYRSFGCKIKVYDYPTVHQLGVEKKYLREFDVEELLFRKPVIVTNEKTSAFYKDKTVLITGGGGSIGSELCRQVIKLQPKRLVILDVYENGAYDVQQELGIVYGKSIDLRVEILSVCNRKALEKVFEAYRPNIVLHAAAHKHVPMMEHNCCEAVENNVFGTLNAVELSEKYGVERFIMVSTDKAVNPTNVMGATKRMCEMIVQSHSKTAEFTTFSATRFGNVLGSAGSVIPLFRRQIMNGGPVTITDKRIIRYFMTIPEASQLVLQSGAMAQNGELFVLDMGKPVRILDLAENMIRLSGFEPYRDIDIIEIGLRPGEKLYEELLIKTEELGKTENSLIFIEQDKPISEWELKEKLDILRNALETGDNNEVREALHQVVPTFKEAGNTEGMDAREIEKAAQIG